VLSDGHPPFGLLAVTWMVTVAGALSTWPSVAV
jgi:hypothetical protein